MPAILYALFASAQGPVRLGWPPAAAIAAVATVSLYASSLSTNGVRALLASAIVGVVFVATMNVSWAALGAVAVVAMLAFAAADRAEVPAPRRNFDEWTRTRVAFEVEERRLVADPATVRPRAGETTTVRLELTRLPSAAEAARGPN